MNNGIRNRGFQKATYLPWEISLLEPGEFSSIWRKVDELDNFDKRQD
jgi:hypothetical protein